MLTARLIALALVLVAGCVTDDAKRGKQYRHDGNLIVRLAARPEFDDLLEEKMLELWPSVAGGMLRENWKEASATGAVIAALIERLARERKIRKGKTA